MENIIQAYFFNKSNFINHDNIINWLIENNLPITQKISEHKFYYKVKFLSEKKLKLQGYTIIRKPLKESILINIAFKQPIINNFVSF
jgi:hypothetical protein